jgi:predicted nucleic acid-binding protein
LIVLDTSVLSAAFRKREKLEEESDVATLLKRLVRQDVPLAIPGIVLQELLSGVRTSDQVERLQAVVEGFPVLTAERDHHVFAARVSNACRRAGVSATTIDCLIAAQTIVARGSLLTLDRDFGRMAPHCGLELLPPHPS